MSQSKYIIVPGYAPLYAMRECFGPEHSPLTKPTPTPIPVIGKLLLQSGKEKVDIYEVVQQGKHWSEPVLLTLENYRKPYREIVGDVVHLDPGAGTIDPPKTPAPVAPTIAPKKEESVNVPINFADELKGIDPGDLTIQTNAELDKKVKEELQQEINENVETSPAPVAEEPVVDQTAKVEAPAEPEADTKPEEPVERAAEDEDEVGDKRTMTRAERKRAAREAREREAAEKANGESNAD